MASIHLRPDLSTTKPRYGQIFNLIQSFLENEASSAAQLSRDLTDPIRTNPQSGANSLWSATSSIWVPLFHIVVQIPEDHPWQDRLIVLLDEISKTPRPSLPELEVNQFEIEYGRFWEGLPVFKYFVSEELHKGRWERTPENAAVMQSPALRMFAPRWTIDEWANVNAFTARCNASLPEVKFHLLPLRVLNHALEVKRRTDSLDDNIPAAAAWILHAGIWLFKKEENSERLENVAVGNPEDMQWLYAGQGGYSKERWAFWKKRFAEEARNAEVTDKTKWFAGKAYEEMVRIEEQEAVE